MRVTHQFAAVIIVTLLLQGGAGLFIMQSVEAANAEQEEALSRTSRIVSATERLSGLANQEVARLLGYLRGASTLEDVNETRAAFAAEADHVRTLAKEDDDLQGVVDGIQRVENRLFDAPTAEGGEPLFELLQRTRVSKEVILENNTQHKELTRGFMLAFGNPARNVSMLEMLVNIESGRVAVLEFEPALELEPDAASARIAHAHGINSGIIRTLSGETAGAMSEFIFQLRDLEDAHSESDPEYADAVHAVRIDLMRLQNRVAATQWSQGVDATRDIMRGVTENVTRAEALGVPVARADVAGVGMDVTEVDVLATLLVHQLNLRHATNEYFEMTLVTQEVIRGSLDARVRDFENVSETAATMARAQADAAKEEVTRDMNAARAAAATMTLLVTVPVGGLGALVVRSLNTRIRSFDDAASAVAMGDFAAPPPPLKGDDFDPLVAAWASMTSALDERERELSHKNAVLQQSERMATLGSLLAGVAHEINNPLAFVKGNEQLALEDVTAMLEDPGVQRHPDLVDVLGEIRESLQANLAGIDRIENTNRALKGFSGPTRSERESVDVNEVVDGVLIIAHNRLKSTFTIERDFGELPRVSASPQEIGQVVLNLLINAADACGERGGTITIRTRTNGDHVLLTVADDGPGVPPEARHKLFTMYATTKEGGTGLGLHISRGIAEAHGGSLDLDDTPRGGSFTMKLPAPRVAVTPNAKSGGSGRNAS